MRNTFLLKTKNKKILPYKNPEGSKRTLYHWCQQNQNLTNENPKYPIISQQNGSQVRSQMIIKKNERHANTGLESPFFCFSHQLDLCWRMKPSAICCCTKSSRCSKNQSRVCGQYDQSMQQEGTQNHLATYFSCSWRINVQCQYTGRSNYLRQRW